MLGPNRMTPPGPRADTSAASGCSAVVAFPMPPTSTVAARASSGAGWQGDVVEVATEEGGAAATTVEGGAALPAVASPDGLQAVRSNASRTSETNPDRVVPGASNPFRVGLSSRPRTTCAHDLRSGSQPSAPMPV
jgi:hypothetical protein